MAETLRRTTDNFGTAARKSTPTDQLRAGVSTRAIGTAAMLDARYSTSTLGITMARRHCVAVAALLAVSLTACDSTGDGGNPPTTPATVSFPDDPNKAPSVPDPIYPEAFIEDSCLSLTSEQRKEFDLASGEPWPSERSGPNCLYHFNNSDRFVRIDYSNRGLQSLYETGPQIETRWEPEVLDGYPAVAMDREDRIGVPPIPPSCYYAVGVDDRADFAVLAQDTDGSSECGLAKKIAAEVLSNIKKSK